MAVRPRNESGLGGAALAEAPQIRMDVPARGSFVRTVRLLTGDVAARAGFSFDDIEDLRLVVTELAYSILVPEAAVLSLRMTVAPGLLVVHGSVDDPGGRARDLDAATMFLVDLVCDRYALDAENVEFSFEKRVRG